MSRVHRFLVARGGVTRDEPLFVLSEVATVPPVGERVASIALANGESLHVYLAPDLKQRLGMLARFL